MKSIPSTFVLFVLFQNIQAQSAWTSLFNGKDLLPFERLNGEAHYKIEDGQIVGISKSGTPNSFLATKKRYTDFILEFEVWADTSLNSGVQIRSNSLPDYQNGRVHGYQIEIDPSHRAYSGGIYDEARRGWLYPLTHNPKGQAAFRNGQWNHYHVEAIGNTLKTWVNGVQCAHLADDLTAEGFIALQVHSISDPALEGREIRWRNLRILTKKLRKNTWADDPQVPKVSLLKNGTAD